MSEITLCVVVGLQCAGKTSFMQVAKQQGCAILEWSKVIYDDFGHPIPAIVLLKQGRVIDQLPGAQTLDVVLAWFRRKA